MIKAFPVFKENGFEFRAEAYNFVNHPNLNSPNYHSHLSPRSGK